MLTVITPAPDLSLLSQGELRLSIGLGVGDSSQDTALSSLGLRAAAALASACGVVRGRYTSVDSPARDGIAPATLRKETVSETFRLRSHQNPLFLNRRPIVDVASLTVDGDAVDGADYEIDAVAGSLLKLSSDTPICWASGKVIVQYSAGFETVPDDLKGWAAQLVSGYYLQGGDDPMEKSVSIPGVIAVERWVDLESDSLLPDDIMSGLIRAGYRVPVLA